MRSPVFAIALLGASALALPASAQTTPSAPEVAPQLPAPETTIPEQTFPCNPGSYQPSTGDDPQVPQDLAECEGVLPPPETGDGASVVDPPETGETPVIAPGDVPEQPAAPGDQ